MSQMPEQKWYERANLRWSAGRPPFPVFGESKPEPLSPVASPEKPIGVQSATYDPESREWVVTIESFVGDRKTLRVPTGDVA